MIPTAIVMNTLRELTRFKDDEDACNFVYLDDNVVTKSLIDSERTEIMVAYLSGAVFCFYFDRFTL